MTDDERDDLISAAKTALEQVGRLRAKARDLGLIEAAESVLATEIDLGLAVASLVRAARGEDPMPEVE